MNPVIQEIVECMAAAGFSEKEQFAVRLSLEEAIVNGCKHGNGNDPRRIRGTLRYTRCASTQGERM